MDGTPAGSDNLEEVFEANLRRTGRVVAILDTWHQPTYLRRVCTGDELGVLFFLIFYPERWDDGMTMFETFSNNFSDE